jgi:hypothetical protein
MSGYTGELVAHQGLQSGIRLLEKPFTRAALLRIIDEALGYCGAGTSARDEVGEQK